MKKKFFFPLLVVLFIGLASANSYSYYNNYQTYYDSNQVFVSKNNLLIPLRDSYNRDFYKESYNEKRYPTYNYRHGYTYRDTREYQRTHLDYRDREDIRRSRHLEDYRTTRRSRDVGDYYDYKNYYRYEPFKQSYKKLDCYDSPPKGKLIYRKCPKVFLYY